MQKHFLKFGKVFTNVACSPLILISNNSEMAAKYLPNDVDQTITNLKIPNINNDFFQVNYFKKEEEFLLVENNNEINEKSVYLRNNYRRLGKSS
jgi:outer membrane protein insertion porin family